MKKIITGLLTFLLLTPLANAAPTFSRDPFQEKNKKEFQDMLKEKQKQQAIIDSQLRSTSGYAQKPETCPSKEQPELILENLKLDGIGQSEDYSSLEYNFSLDIKNYYNGSFGPLSATKGVSISIFDGTKLQADGLANSVMYGQLLSDYSLLTTTLADTGGKPFKLGCNKSMNFKNIKLSLPKDANTNNLIFMIDSKNQYQEKNDTPNQNTKTNASLKDNNVTNYQIVQPFESFKLDVSKYDTDTKQLNFAGTFNFLNSNSENDLKKLGYGFVTEVWQADNGNSFENLKYNSLNEAYEIQFLGNFIKKKPIFPITVISTSEMSNDPTIWKTNKNLDIYSTANHFAVLSLQNPTGEKYPLYVIKAVFQENPETTDYKNCDYKAGECKYLIFKRTSDESIDADPANISEENPQPTSTFEACNESDTAATIQSLKFRVITKAEKIPNGAKITNTFDIDGKEIWDSVSYTNYGYNQYNFSEIILKEPLIINPGKCNEINVTAISADPAYKYQVMDLSNVKSDIKPYIFDPYNDQLKEFSDWNWVIGTGLVMTAENGALMVFNSNLDGNSAAYDNPGTIDAINLQLSTNPNQTFNFNQLDFEVSSNYTGDLKAKVSIDPSASIYGWQFASWKEITIPANGNFSLKDLNISLGYSQKNAIILSLVGPFKSEGQVKITLKKIDSGDQDLSITETHPGIPYEKEWLVSKELPLSNTVYLIVPNAVSSLEFSMYPNSSLWGYQNWFSETKMGKEKMWHMGINAGYSGVNTIPEFVKTEENMKTIKLSDLNIVMDGSFEKMDLQFDISGGGKNIQIVKTVSPGDTVTLPLPNIDIQYNSIDIDISPAIYPDLDLFNLDEIEATPQPLSATYFDGSKIPMKIEVSTLDEKGQTKYSKQEFLLPYIEANQRILGKEALYLSSNGNSPLPKTKKIALLQPDEEIIMNDTCFNAIGDIKIKKLIYQHDAHDVQPFEKVILGYAATNIFLPLEGWTVNTATFSPTPPEDIDHNNSPCFKVKVKGPKIPLEKTFFDLIGIEAVIDGTEIAIPVVADTNTKDLLSTDKPIKGTVTNFK